VKKFTYDETTWQVCCSNIRHMKKELQHPFYLREWRKHRGLSQMRLANRIGTTNSYISQLENRRKPYNETLLNALADALDCEPGELLNKNPLVAGEVVDWLDGVPPEKHDQFKRVVREMKRAFVDEEQDNRRSG